jgi:hypothetical protein
MYLVCFNQLQLMNRLRSYLNCVDTTFSNISVRYLNKSIDHLQVVHDKFCPIKLYRIHLTMMTLYTSIYLNLDLSLAPLYWCVAMWKMWRNHSTGHMRVTLCHDPVHLMKKNMMVLKCCWKWCSTSILHI